MALILEAHCPCGYEGRSVLGAGMSDFHKHCSAPALCTVCARVVTIDLMETPPLCPVCTWEAIPYDSWTVQDVDNSLPLELLADWNLPDGRTFILPQRALYACPRCTEATMTFKVLGFID